MCDVVMAIVIIQAIVVTIQPIILYYMIKKTAAKRLGMNDKYEG